MEEIFKLYLYYFSLGLLSSQTTKTLFLPGIGGGQMKKSKIT